MGQNGPPPVDAPPSAADIEALAAAIYESLPEEFRALTSAVVFQVVEFPDSETMEELGVNDAFDLLGLYRGVSLDQRSILDTPTDVDIVFLYRRPILDYWCETGESSRRSCVTYWFTKSATISDCRTRTWRRSNARIDVP